MRTAPVSTIEGTSRPWLRSVRPPHRAARRRLVYGLVRLGRSEEAEAAIAALVALDPRDPDALRQRELVRAFVVRSRSASRTERSAAGAAADVMTLAPP